MIKIKKFELANDFYNTPYNNDWSPIDRLMFTFFTEVIPIKCLNCGHHEIIYTEDPKSRLTSISCKQCFEPLWSHK